VPLSTVLLLGLCGDGQLSCVFVDFLVQFGVDGADFGVCDTVSLALRVENGMDVEARGGGFSRGETDALDEFFL
jgi:hypothetical protein